MVIVPEEIVLERAHYVVVFIAVVGDAIVAEEGVRVGQPQFCAFWPKWPQRTAPPSLLRLRYSLGHFQSGLGVDQDHDADDHDVNSVVVVDSTVKPRTVNPFLIFVDQYTIVHIYRI